MADILDNPEASRLFHSVALELADKYAGLDEERTASVLARTACDIHGRPFTKWPKAKKATGSKVLTMPPIWFFPTISEALRYLSPEEALALFEQDDLERLGMRQAYTSYLSSGDAPLYTIKQCATEIDRLLKHQQREGEREHLVRTGYPKTVFERSALLGSQMVELYPIKLPAWVTEEDGEYSYNWSLDPWLEDSPLCSYEDAPLYPGLDPRNIEKLESMRDNLFEARAQALTAIARWLRGSDPKAMWRGVSDALLEALSADNMYFFLGIDSSRSGFELSQPRSSLSANGALSALLSLAGHAEKELVVRTMAKTAEALGGLVRAKKLKHPKVPIQSYYAVLGTSEQERFESACDMLAKLEEKEQQFWLKFEQRVNRVLAVQSEKEGAALKRGEVEYVAKFSSAIQAPDQEYLTAEEVAHRSGVHTKTIYLMARKGALPSRRIGNAVRFIWSEVDEALRAEAERNVDARRNDRRQ